MSDSTRRPPFDDVRAAFERLTTPDKAAFVFEATFDTLGQAISETGRRFSAAVSNLDLDSVFGMDGDRMDGEPAAPDAGAAPKARPRAPRRNPGVPPTDDLPPAV